ERGDTESFQFLQEIKEFLWDYNGQPRKMINKIKWSRERMLVNGWVYEPTIKAWIKKGKNPVFTNDYTEE
ncbi:MAG: hypothetical protein ACRC0F_05005, partial [Cetobacterium sp.]